MELFCYHLAPIDFSYGSLTGEEVLAMILGRGELVANVNQTTLICQEKARLLTTAERVFDQVILGADALEGPFFFTVPGETDLPLGYVHKREDIGECFVVSPVELDEQMLSIADKRVIKID